MAQHKGATLLRWAVGNVGFHGREARPIPLDAALDLCWEGEA